MDIFSTIYKYEKQRDILFMRDRARREFYSERSFLFRAAATRAINKYRSTDVRLNINFYSYRYNFTIGPNSQMGWCDRARRYPALVYSGTNWRPASWLSRVLCFDNAACASYLIPFCGRQVRWTMGGRRGKGMCKFIVRRYAARTRIRRRARTFFLPRHLRRLLEIPGNRGFLHVLPPKENITRATGNLGCHRRNWIFHTVAVIISVRWSDR